MPQVSGDGRRDGEATRGRRPGSGGKLLDGARSEEEEASAWSLRRSGGAGKIPTTMRRQQQKLEAGPEPAGVDAGERESEEAGMALRLLRRLQQKLGARPWLGVGEGRQGRRGTTGSLTGEREEAAPARVSSAGDARWRRELRWRRGAGRLRRCGRRTEQGGDDGCCYRERSRVSGGRRKKIRRREEQGNDGLDLGATRTACWVGRGMEHLQRWREFRGGGKV